MKMCLKCHGGGRITCPRCNGSGFEPKEQAHECDLPYFCPHCSRLGFEPKEQGGLLVEVANTAHDVISEPDDCTECYGFKNVACPCCGGCGGCYNCDK